MDDSLLEQSHRAGSQALKLQREGSYELAARCHLLAADLLTLLQQRLPSENSLVNNFNYFIAYHRRQAELDEIIAGYKKGSTLTNTESIEHSKTDIPPTPSTRLFRIFEEPDSLLPQSVCAMPNKYSVKPKSDAEVIEEYKTMIDNLRQVVERQAKELEEWRKKSQRDDETIRNLKLRLEKYEPPPSTFDTSQYVPVVIPELPPLEQPPDYEFVEI